MYQEVGIEPKKKDLQKLYQDTLEIQYSDIKDTANRGEYHLVWRQMALVIC